MNKSSEQLELKLSEFIEGESGPDQKIEVEFRMPKSNEEGDQLDYAFDLLWPTILENVRIENI